MALLDTLKKSLSSAASYVTAPITAPFKAAKSSFDATMNMAKNAAASRPTTPSSPANTPTTLGAYNPTSQQSGSLAVTGTGPVPTNVSSGVTTKSNSNYVAPQMSKIPAGTTQPQTAPAPAPAPVQNTQSGSYNNMGIGTFQQSNDPAVQALIRSTNATMAGNTTPAATTTPTPATTSIAPTDNGLSELEKKLLGTYEVSAEERALRAEAERIDRQAAELRAGINSGLTKIEGQPITLGLLRGQQAMTARQGNDALNALTGSQNTLENRLKTLAGDRSLANEAAQKEYAMAAARAKGSEPIEVGGSLIQLNPGTGKYEVVYQAPSKEDGGFTLGEGQMRYDANGNLVASGAPKSTTTGGDKITMVDGKPFIFENGVLTPVGVPQATDPATQAKKNETLSLVNEILNDGNLSGIIGPINSKTPVLRGESQDLINKITRLQSLLTLDNLGKGYLKGAISDRDLETLSSAAASLQRGGSVEGFRQELNRIAGTLQNSQPTSTQSIGVTPNMLMQKGVSQSMINEYINSGLTMEDLAEDAGISFTSASGQALNLPIPKEYQKASSPLGTGVVTAYGSPLWKPGLDYVLEGGPNAPVKMPLSGTVIGTGVNGGFGNQVKIRLDDGNELWVSHLNAINVKPGTKITPGTLIGLQGNTGSTIKSKGGTGTHLDLTMKKPGGGYYSAQEVAKYLGVSTA